MDRKPTQLLHRMQQLLGDRAVPQVEPSYENCFYNAYPPTPAWYWPQPVVLQVLMSLLSLLTRYIVEVATPTIAATSSPLSQLTEVEQLQVNKLQTSIRTLARHTRRRSSSRIVNPVPLVQCTMCWYHQTYAEATQKFKSPCTYTPSSNDQPSR